MRLNHADTLRLIKKVGDVRVAQEMVILIMEQIEPLTTLTKLCEDQLPSSGHFSDRLTNEVGRLVTRELRDALDNFSIDGDSIYDEAVILLARQRECLEHDGNQFVKDEDGNCKIREGGL